MLRPLRRYASFSGRARRREYWLFILLSWLVLAPIGLIGLALGWSPFHKGAFDPLPPGGGNLVDQGVTVALCVAALALLLPYIAVQVRRFHDTNRPAWMLVWNFIPYVGTLVLLFYMLRPGTEGPNRYGPDPTEEVDEWGRIRG